eukprot:30885-Pelagococcus_subviridis.AAC.4
MAPIANASAASSPSSHPPSASRAATDASDNAHGSRSHSAPSTETASSSPSPAPKSSGSFHTSDCWGGVERRQCIERTSSSANVSGRPGSTALASAIATFCPCTLTRIAGESRRALTPRMTAAELAPVTKKRRASSGSHAAIAARITDAT